jgi:hypothetical protein
MTIPRGTAGRRTKDRLDAAVADRPIDAGEVDPDAVPPTDDQEQEQEQASAFDPTTPPAGPDPGPTPAEQGRQAGEAEQREGNGIPTDPDERAAQIEQLRADLARLDATAPSPDRTPAIPTPPSSPAGRLGTDLGGLELVKAGFRAMFPGAPEGLDLEWALTMGASDLIGQMLNHHRQPAFADPGLIAALRTLVEQLDKAAAVRTVPTDPAD